GSPSPTPGSAAAAPRPGPSPLPGRRPARWPRPAAPPSPAATLPPVAGPVPPPLAAACPWRSPEERGLLPLHRLPQHRTVQVLVAPLAARLGGEQAGVTGRPVQGQAVPVGVVLRA